MCCRLKTESVSKWIVCFVIAGILQGIGNSVLQSRGATAAEDQTNETKGGANQSIINGGILGGSILGILVTTFVLRIWTDLSEQNSVDLDPSDPNWIGAWWVPFLIQFVVSCFAFPFLFGFPKVLPGAPKRERSEKTDFRSELDASKIVLKNSCWWFCIIGSICHMYPVTGTSSYGMKLLQEVFPISVSTAGLCAGLTAIGGLIGCLIPIPFGFYKLPSYKLLLICFLTSVSYCIIFPLRIYAFTCENQHIYGIINEDGNPRENFSLESCSDSCGTCDTERFEPVCDEETNTIYFSPCHAGCRNVNLADCLCDGSPRKNLTDGLCNNSSECDSLWKFTLCQAIAVMLLYVPFPIITVKKSFLVLIFY